MSGISSFCSNNQLIILSSFVSILIADDLSADDLNILGAFFNSVGDLLSLKAAQLAADDTQNCTKQQIKAIEEQIKKLKDCLK